jgi:hypothetical protein
VPLKSTRLIPVASTHWLCIAVFALLRITTPCYFGILFYGFQGLYHLPTFLIECSQMFNNCCNFI